MVDRKLEIEIADHTFRVTEGFPRREQYGLASHMRKTSVSIPSNIAEGYARQHRKEYRQHCYISLGSCAELETKLEEARDQLAEAFEELKKVELIEERDAERVRVHEAAKEQAELDEIGINMTLAGETH